MRAERGGSEEEEEEEEDVVFDGKLALLAPPLVRVTG